MSGDRRIDQVFQRLAERQHMAFMPFLTAGDPDLDFTARLIETMAAAGADLIEVGFPYSDPIADGPVIQASYTRALESGLKIPALFDTIEQLATDDLPPLVAMVAYGIIFRIGPEQFVKRCVKSGFSGVIVPDLPGDEAAEFAAIAQHHELDLIELIAPTTPERRVERILKACSGFLYCISVAGTTGERAQLPSELLQQLKQLKSQTKLPLAVGFGISTPEHVAPLRGVADGAIVGSALVRRLQQLADGELSREQVLAEVSQFVREMVEATKKTG